MTNEATSSSGDPNPRLVHSANRLEHSARQQTDSANRRTELAADRTVMAAERTYAAWVRTGIGQPALSQQLGELRRAELVATRREARLIYYRIIDEEMEERIRVLFDAFGPQRPIASKARTAFPRRKSTAHPIGAASFARIG